MLKMQFDVDKVHNHAPGWEDEWGRIVANLLGYDNSSFSSDKEENDFDVERSEEIDDECDDLMNIDQRDDETNDDENCELSNDTDPFDVMCKQSAFLKICRNIINERCSYAVKSEKCRLTEEFASYVITIYQERVNAQNLFTDYSPELGTVIQYLCSTILLHLYYHGFQREVTVLRISSIDIKDDEKSSGNTGDTKTNKSTRKRSPHKIHITVDSESIEETINSKEKTPEENYDNENRQKKFLALLNSLGSMVINCPRKGSRQYEQTGLQLYPRLDVKDAEMLALCQCSRDVIKCAHNISCDDSDAMIRQRHEILGESYEKTILNKMDELNTSQRIKKNRRNVLSNQIILLHRQLYFSPLEAKDISELCKISIDLAYTYRSRYLKDIPVIMEKYYTEFDNDLNN